MSRCGMCLSTRTRRRESRGSRSRPRESRSRPRESRVITPRNYKEMTAEWIKVMCRFRPLNKLEPDPANITITDNTIITESGEFNFDKVFEDGTTQEGVYSTIGSSLIESFIQGYNCTLFAYGQTSSGKTYTLTGSRVRPGITPRLSQDLYASLQKLVNDKPDIEVVLKVSYYEIYLEKIRDLLSTSSTELKVRETGKSVWIQGLSEHTPISPEEFDAVVTAGLANRSVGETKMNERSSRSHSVLSIKLEQTNGKSVITSKLLIIDLAGSESVGKTGATGQTLLEAQYTNKSLTTLGVVIKHLTDGSKHVPFRDSKLTRILSDSLGGNSKTVLLIACSPAERNIAETLSTLRFGARVKTIKNKPVINAEKTVEEYKEIIHDLQQRVSTPDSDVIRELREELEQTQARLVKANEEIETLQSQLIGLRDERNIDRVELEISKRQSTVIDKILKTGASAHVRSLINTKDEIISLLEMDIKYLETQNRRQRESYENLIKLLRSQVEELTTSIYKPVLSKGVRKIVRGSAG